MALPSQAWDQITSNFSFSLALAATTTAIVAYHLGRCIYNLNFHPLSKYPGPRLAAGTNLWWAYASTTGRYPWIIANALREYGDVIRIAPNELVFVTPQAAKDIYLAQEKNLEVFVQVGYDALDTGDGGISGETNPVRHREIAKKLAPAFSTRNLKAKEAAVHKHIDFFVNKMKDFESDEQGVELQCWTDWLGLDLAADMTYGKAMGHVRDMKDSVFLKASLQLNLFLTLSQITRKFRLFSFLSYFTIPPSVWFAMPRLIRMNTEDVKMRIERRGKTEHLDYFEQLVPAEKPVPEDRKQIFHLENVAGQLLLASWQPMSNQFYSCIIFLLKKHDAYIALVEEIRTSFTDYNAINIESIASLKYLQACTQESLRLHQETADGLPRISPGAVVDGLYIPKGVTCQISYFAAARNPKFFTDPLRFCPERWLGQDHPKYNPKYKDDDLRASKPFSQGPRGCPGGAIASAVIRLFIAKVLWEFDLEAVQGQNDITFDEDFRFFTFWEKPRFWVRFKPVQGEGRERERLYSSYL